MAVSGWYPDPGGAPGRFRYWDGNRWSSDTTDNPNNPPPSARPRQQTAEPAPRSRTGWIVGLVALLVVVVVIGVLVIRSLGDRGAALTDPDPPQSTVSGWDDSSPLPTATPTPTPTASPSPPRSPTPTASDSGSPHGEVSCAAGDPYDREPHPADGRIHGGALSFASPGWETATSYAQQMTWAHDVDGVDEETEPGWAAMMAVGALDDEDGFHTPEQSADGMMQCIASSAYYSDFIGRKDVFSKKVTIDGRPAWALRSQILVDNPGLSVPGDIAEVIVVDTGKQGQLSFYAGFVPIGDQARVTLLDQAIAGLRVE